MNYGHTLKHVPYILYALLFVPSSSTSGRREGCHRGQIPGPVQVAVQWRHSPPSGPHGSTLQRTPSSSCQFPLRSSPPLALLHLLLHQSVHVHTNTSLLCKELMEVAIQLYDTVGKPLRSLMATV